VLSKDSLFAHLHIQSTTNTNQAFSYLGNKCIYLDLKNRDSTVKTDHSIRVYNSDKKLILQAKTAYKNEFTTAKDSIYAAIKDTLNAVFQKIKYYSIKVGEWRFFSSNGNLMRKVNYAFPFGFPKDRILEVKW